MRNDNENKANQLNNKVKKYCIMHVPSTHSMHCGNQLNYLWVAQQHNSLKGNKNRWKGKEDNTDMHKEYK